MSSGPPLRHARLHPARRRVVRSEAGATAVEYGLVVGLIAVSLLTGAALVGSRVSGVLSSAACSLGAAIGEACDSTSTSPASPMVLAASDWCPPSTNGTIVCRAVDKLNTVAWSSPDVTVATTAALTGTNWNQQTGTGSNGYGLWLRATSTPGFGVTSGYTFQVDPGAGSRFVIKVWNTTSTNNVLNRTETTLGMVGFPPGFDPTASNRIAVSLLGNSLTASVNGTAVFTNFDVAAASTSRGKTPPAGTQYGVRTWGQAGLSMATTTVV
ncbi:MAG: Flp family type IVb pilin [Actinobacteria bacterium]|nr:Flp family type IVb pilin [Actinomycetota bacterium]